MTVNIKVHNKPLPTYCKVPSTSELKSGYVIAIKDNHRDIANNRKVWMRYGHTGTLEQAIEWAKSTFEYKMAENGHLNGDIDNHLRIYKFGVK